MLWWGLFAETSINKAVINLSSAHQEITNKRNFSNTIWNFFLPLEEPVVRGGGSSVNGCSRSTHVWWNSFLEVCSPIVPDVIVRTGLSRWSEPWLSLCLWKRSGYGTMITVGGFSTCRRSTSNLQTLQWLYSFEAHLLLQLCVGMLSLVLSFFLRFKALCLRLAS